MFSIICGLRTIYLISLKNLIFVDIVKCQVKFCLLFDFIHILLFLTILASTGGPHEISWRAARCPRAAGWTALAYIVNSQGGSFLVTYKYYQHLIFQTLRTPSLPPT